MLYTLKNNFVSFTVDTSGAELHSIKSKDIEYLWQAGPSWRRYAPILFPFICSPNGKKYSANDKEYTMPSKHGFARDSEFDFVNKTDDSITFVLKSSPETLKLYPYDFVLTVTYTLRENKIITSCVVKNAGKNDMYFYLGGHPAFNCPIEEGLDFSDYYVEYEKNENIVQTLPDGNSRTILNNENKMQLSHELFDFDVIMKDAPNSKTITLKSDKSPHSATVEFPDSNCIAVWSPAGDNNATFVCLEPWTSVPTYADDDEFAIENKKHAIKLAPNNEFSYEFSIVID